MEENLFKYVKKPFPNNVGKGLTFLILHSYVPYIY